MQKNNNTDLNSNLCRTELHPDTFLILFLPTQARWLLTGASDLAELALESIANSEARDTVLVWHGAVDVQEGQRRITTKLWVGPKRSEVDTGIEIVAESDGGWEVGRRVKSARTLAAIETSHESVLEDPVGAGSWMLETGCSAVAGAVDAVLEEEVDGGRDTCDIDAGKVANTPTIVGGGLQVREALLGDLAAADGVVIIFVVAGEDVDVLVGVIVLVADFEGGEGSCDDG